MTKLFIAIFLSLIFFSFAFIVSVYLKIAHPKKVAPVPVIRIDTEDQNTAFAKRVLRDACVQTFSPEQIKQSGPILDVNNAFDTNEEEFRQECRQVL